MRVALAFSFLFLAACRAATPSHGDRRPRPLPGRRRADRRALRAARRVRESRRARRTPHLAEDRGLARAQSRSGADPLVFLAGGPGQGAAKLAREVRELFGRIQADRDIVLVDQRGTGDSNPLDCSKRGRLARRAVRTRRCRPATAEAVPGGIRRRSALLHDDHRHGRPRRRPGPSRIRAHQHLWGVLRHAGRPGLSAAARRARTHARARWRRAHRHAPPALFPAGRSAGAGPPARRLRGRSGLRREVSASRRSRTDAVRPPRARSTGRPSRASANRGGRNRTRRRDSRRQPRVRRAVLAPDVVDGARIARPRGAGRLPGHARTGHGQRRHVLQYERWHAAVGDRARKMRRGSSQETWNAPRLARSSRDASSPPSSKACDFWPRGKVPADYYAPVVSAVPALLLSGDVDPVTPPSWGEMVSAHLTNATHLTAPFTGHGVVGDGLRRAHRPPVRRARAAPTASTRAVWRAEAAAVLPVAGWRRSGHGPGRLRP